MFTNTCTATVWGVIQSTVVGGGMLRCSVNEGQGGADGMQREPERAQRGVRGREGPEEGWSRLLIGTPCSQASLDGHTYLSNGKGPTNRLHYWTHLGLAPDKVTASPHGKRTLWLVVKENKSHRIRIRCHLLDGSDKYERSCTPIIKRWEKVRIYYQYLIRYYKPLKKNPLNREITLMVMVSFVFDCDWSQITQSGRW